MTLTRIVSSPSGYQGAPFAASGTGTQTITTPTAGNALIVVIWTYNAATFGLPTVADNQGVGNVYSVHGLSSNQRMCVAMCPSVALSGGAFQITVTPANSSDFVVWYATEWSHTGTLAFDAGATEVAQHPTGSGTHMLSSGSATGTTASNSALWYTVCDEPGVIVAASWANGSLNMTLEGWEDDNSTSESGAGGYRLGSLGGLNTIGGLQVNSTSQADTSAMALSITETVGSTTASATTSATASMIAICPRSRAVAGTSVSTAVTIRAAATTSATASMLAYESVRYRTAVGGTAASGAGFTISFPTGTVTGDLVLLAVENAGTAGPAAPTGWRQLDSASPGSGANLAIFTATWTSGLTTSFTNAASVAAWACQSYFANGQVVLFDTLAGTSNTTNNTAMPTGQPTPTLAGDFEALIYGFTSNPTITQAAGTTIDITQPNSTTVSVAIGHNNTLSLPTGAPAAFSQTLSASNNRKRGVGVLLDPVIPVTASAALIATGSLVAASTLATVSVTDTATLTSTFSVSARASLSATTSLTAQIIRTIVSNVGNVPACTGRPPQSHLVYAPNTGRWWLFYWDAADTTHLKCVVSSSGDLSTASWSAGATSPVLAGGSGPTHQNEGRNIAVTLKSISSTDIVHIVTSHGLTNARGPNHIRATITAATTISWDPWSLANNWAAQPSPSSSEPASPAVALSSDNHVHAFLNDFDNSGDAGSYISSSTDAGSSFTDTWPNAATIYDTSMASICNSFASFPLAAAAMVVLYDAGENAGNGTAHVLFKKYTSGVAWPVGTGATVQSGVNQQDKNDWGAVRVSDTDVHFVRRASANTYEHRRYDGTTWSAGQTIPNQNSLAGGGTYLASDGADVWLFVIDTATGNPIRYLKWVPTGGGVWDSTWGTLAAHDATVKGFVSGPQTVGNNQLAVVWTAGAGTPFSVGYDSVQLLSAALSATASLSATGISAAPGLLAKVGSLAVPASTGSQSITGIGFQPEALLFYAVNVTADGQSVFGANPAAGIQIGAAVSSASRWSVSSGASNSGSATSRVSATECLALIDPDNNAVTLATADLTSIDSDGFTLNWLTNVGTSRDGVIVNYLALGGPDLTNSATTHFTLPNATGNQSYTGLGFQPDLVLLCGADVAGTLPATAAAAAYHMGMGFGTSSTQRFWWAESGESNDTRAQSDAGVFGMSAGTGSATPKWEADLVSMDSDGFTLNWTTVQVGVNPHVFALALKGGSYTIGGFAQPSTTGTQTISGLPTTPRAVVLGGANEAGTGYQHASNFASWSLGVTDGTNRSYIATGQSSSAGIRLSRTADIAFVEDQQVTFLRSEADISSVSSSSFVENWTTINDTTARRVLYLAIGNAVTAAITATTSDNASLSAAIAVVASATTSGTASLTAAQSVSARATLSATTSIATTVSVTGWYRVPGATLATSLGGSMTGTWVAGALGAAVAVGNRIICVIETCNTTTQPTVTSVTDSLGNAYAKDDSLQDLGFIFEEVSVWSAPVTTPGTPTITVHVTNPESGGISAGAYSGLSTATSGYLDLHLLKFNNTSANPATSGTTSGTTTADHELKLGIYGDAGFSNALAAGSGYSTFVKDDNDVNAQTLLEDADSGASGSTATATVSNGGNQYCVCGVLAYRLAGVVTPVTANLTASASLTTTQAVAGRAVGIATSFGSQSLVTYGTHTNTVITAPSGINNGDTLVIVHDIAATGGPPTPTAPAGFTLLPGYPVTISDISGFQLVTRAWWKVANNESGNYTVTHTSASSEAYMIRVPGGDPSTPMQPVGTSATIPSSAGSFISVPGLITDRAGSLVMLCTVNWAAAGGLPGPNSLLTFTERSDSSAQLLFVTTASAANPNASTGDPVVMQLNNSAGSGPASGVLIAFDPAPAPLLASATLAATAAGTTTGSATVTDTASLTAAGAVAASATTTATASLTTTQAVAGRAAAIATSFGSQSLVTYGTHTNTVITAPSGIRDGDILVIIHDIGATGGPPTPTAPAGFTLLPGYPVSATDGLGFQITTRAWWKVASGEAGSYTVTHTSASSEAYMIRVPGGDPSTPMLPVGTTATLPEASGTHLLNIPGLVTDRAGSFVVLYAVNWNTAGGLPGPTSLLTFTERSNSSSQLLFVTTASPADPSASTGNPVVQQVNNGSLPGTVAIGGLIALDPAPAPLRATATMTITAGGTTTGSATASDTASLTTAGAIAASATTTATASATTVSAVSSTATCSASASLAASGTTASSATATDTASLTTAQQVAAAATASATSLAAATAQILATATASDAASLTTAQAVAARASPVSSSSATTGSPTVAASASLSASATLTTVVSGTTVASATASDTTSLVAAGAVATSATAAAISSASAADAISAAAALSSTAALSSSQAVRAAATAADTASLFALASGNSLASTTATTSLTSTVAVSAAASASASASLQPSVAVSRAATATDSATLTASGGPATTVTTSASTSLTTTSAVAAAATTTATGSASAASSQAIVGNATTSATVSLSATAAVSAAAATSATGSASAASSQATIGSATASATTSLSTTAAAATAATAADSSSLVASGGVAAAASTSDSGSLSATAVVAAAATASDSGNLSASGAVAATANLSAQATAVVLASAAASGTCSASTSLQGSAAVAAAATTTAATSCTAFGNIAGFATATTAATTSVSTTCAIAAAATASASATLQIVAAIPKSATCAATATCAAVGSSGTLSFASASVSLATAQAVAVSQSLGAATSVTTRSVTYGSATLASAAALATATALSTTATTSGTTAAAASAGPAASASTQSSTALSVSAVSAVRASLSATTAVTIRVTVVARATAHAEVGGLFLVIVINASTVATTSLQASGYTSAFVSTVALVALTDLTVQASILRPPWHLVGAPGGNGHVPFGATAAGGHTTAAAAGGHGTAVVAHPGGARAAQPRP